MILGCIHYSKIYKVVSVYTIYGNMKYKIKDADGYVYTFSCVEEVLDALAKALGSEHKYYWNGEWYDGGCFR